MGPLDLVNLAPLMERTAGRPEMMLGLIDGPVAVDHPDLIGGNIREVSGMLAVACSRATSVACMHGTFVAGVLCAKRGSVAPAICPGCTLLVRPIFSETVSANGDMPSAMPEELAAALVDTINAGARLINLSAAVARPSAKGESQLTEALDYAARRSVIVVVAAGNQGTVGGSVISSHPWVIPVAACDLQGRTMALSNLGSSIGRHGLTAPGDNITSLGTNGKAQTSGGTSAAVPFVVGAIALLWSEFPSASASQVKMAVLQAETRRQRTIAPPLLDAGAAYSTLKNGLGR